MPMKCVVCGQLTDAEKRNAELQASLNEATTRVGEYREALGVSSAEIDLLRASKAEVETFVVDLRARVFESERALAKAQKDLALFDPAAVVAYGDKRARDAADARDAVWRWAVKESWHGITHWEGCPCAALHKLMEGGDAQKP